MIRINSSKKKHTKDSTTFYKNKYFLYFITGICVIGIIILIGKTIIWNNESVRWQIAQIFYKYDPNKKLTIAPAINNFSQLYTYSNKTQVNDASWLNQTEVLGVYQPTNVLQVKQLIMYAKNNDKKISLSGVRHSMGGQAFLKDSILLDMTKMDSITFNEDKTVTVGPGATWRQIQVTLDKYDRSVAVMQDSNIFTVGGSVSVNAHGKDPRFKSIISTVNYFKIVTADGNEIISSRKQNPELFKAVIGGYGLFGVITEVNLNTTDNSQYEFTLQQSKTSELLEQFEDKWGEKNVELIEAHISIDKNNFLTDSLLYTYKKDEVSTKTKTDTTGENSISLRKVTLDFSKANDFGKLSRWEIEKYVVPIIEAKSVNRNTAMSAPVRFLEHTDENSTDILQEYFIPKEKFNDFLSYFKDFIPSHKLNLVNVTVRKVPKDTEAVLSYAKEDMYAFVVYYSINQDSKDVEKLKSATQEIMSYLNTIKATYYLCYGPYYSKDQLITMYPEINDLFKQKNTYDPSGLFSSNWYERIKNDTHYLN